MYWLSHYLSQRFIGLALRDTVLILAVVFHLMYLVAMLALAGSFARWPDVGFLIGWPLTLLILFAVSTVSIALNPPLYSTYHAVFLFVFLYLGLRFSGLYPAPPLDFVGGPFGSLVDGPLGLLVTGLLALILSFPIRRYMGWSTSASERQSISLPSIKTFVYSLRDGAIIGAFTHLSALLLEKSVSENTWDVIFLLRAIIPEIGIVVLAAIAISLRPKHGSGSYAVELFLWTLIIGMLIGYLFVWGGVDVLFSYALLNQVGTCSGVAIAWFLSYPIRNVIQKKRASP